MTTEEEPEVPSLDIRRNLGKFSIHMDDITDNQEEVLALMGKLVVVRAELHYYDMNMEYIAMSPLFDIVKDGQAVPEYDIMFDDNGDIHVDKAHEA